MVMAIRENTYSAPYCPGKPESLTLNFVNEAMMIFSQKLENQIFELIRILARQRQGIYEVSSYVLLTKVSAFCSPVGFGLLF